MEHDPTKWVAERAKCDMGKLFADLARLVQTNVGQWNAVAMDEESMHGQMAMRPYIGRTRMVEHTATDKPESLTLRYLPEANIVQVARNETSVGTVTTRWDAETQTCQVVVQTDENTEPLEFPHGELAKAVACLLEPFFFPNGHTRHE